MKRTNGVLIAIGLVAGLCPAVAHAGSRVAVLGVAGDQTGDVEDALATMVGGEHEVVSSQAFERAADRAGVKDLDTRGIAKVAKKLSVDAVLEGVLSRDDEGYQLLVRVRTQTGKTTKKLTIIMPGKQLSAKARRSLGDRLLVAIDDLGGNAASTRRVRDEPVEDEAARDEERAEPRRRAERAEPRRRAERDEPPARADRDDDRPKARADRDDDRPRARADRDDDRPRARADRDDDRPKARDDRDDDAREAERDAEGGDDRAARDGEGRDRVAMRDDDSPDDRDDRDDRDDGITARASRREGRPLLAAIVEAGPSVTGRSLTFATRGNFAQAPDGYTGPYVPGARVAGAIYPLAFTKAGGAAAGLGLDFEYDQTLSLTTRTSAAADIALPTTQKHWVVGARYRIAFGQRATSPSVTLGAGYGRRVFIVDRSGLPAGIDLDLPDVDYRFIAPSVGLRLPVGRVTLTADGRALLFRKAGAIQNPDQYGGAKVTGGDAQIGLEVAVTSRVMVHLSGYGTIIGFDFVGNGAASTSRDDDPTTQDVGGARDQYVGGAIALGVAY